MPFSGSVCSAGAEPRMVRAAARMASRWAPVSACRRASELSRLDSSVDDWLRASPPLVVPLLAPAVGKHQKIYSAGKIL